MLPITHDVDLSAPDLVPTVATVEGAYNPSPADFSSLEDFVHTGSFSGAIHKATVVPAVRSICCRLSVASCRTAFRCCCCCCCFQVRSYPDAQEGNVAVNFWFRNVTSFAEEERDVLGIGGEPRRTEL